MIFFVFAAFGISWAAIFPFRNVSLEIVRQVPAAYALVILSGCGPTLAGLLAAGRDLGARGPGNLILRLLPRPAHAGWMLLALAGPVALGAAATVLTVWRGVPLGPTDTAAFSGFGATLAAHALLSGLAQEVGWRGYLTPWLQRRIHPFGATLLTGLVWAAWHTPRLLMSPADSYGLPIFNFVVILVAASVALTWITNRTGGNLFVCVLLHGSLLATEEVFQRAVPVHWLGGNVVYVFTALWVVVALMILLGTGGRLGAVSRTSPPGSAGTATTGP